MFGVNVTASMMHGCLYILHHSESFAPSSWLLHYFLHVSHNFH